MAADGVGKKLINSVNRCVDECLEGLVAVNPGIQVLEGHRVVIRADIEEVKAAGKVTVLTGGGSGHEPAHSGYVGPGMLSGVIAGAVFTSPPPSSILAAIRVVGQGNPAGTLLVVKNYTGDRLNFGLAMERARAEGLKVDMVFVGEDRALMSADKITGRRGLAGTLFIHKIAGALAEEGKSLEEIVSATRQAIKEMGTIGLSLSPCSLPGAGPSFNLQPDEMELGLGIHGEAGVKRMKLQSAKDSVATMLNHMTNPESSTRLAIKKGDRVALMINNLGGTSFLELNIVAKEALLWLEQNGVDVVQAYFGALMTALEMAGVSLTLIHLDETRERCLAASTQAPGWAVPLWVKGSHRLSKPTLMKCPPELGTTDQTTSGVEINADMATVLHKALSYACEALGNCEKQLNILDTEAGDGDCGSTFKRGTDAILQALGPVEKPGLPVTHPQSLGLVLAAVIEQNMGGSSGALYSLFMAAAGNMLAEEVTPWTWCHALGAGLEAVSRYGGASPGDRTMLDALHAAHCKLTDQLQNNVPAMQAFHAAVQAAESEAQATATMVARAGRSSYVHTDHHNQPDPGAHAVGIWMRAAYEACKLAYK